MSRILIVEDEVSLRDDLVVFLEAKGYEVTGAAGFVDAMRQVEASRFDVIVLDIGLPDGNGIDLLKQVRARCGLDCGVVVLTSRQELQDKLQALDAGSDAYLVKHASLREIEGTVRNLLRRLPTVVPPEPCWTLDQKGRSLTAPTGQTVSLTPRELVFLLQLAAADGETCDHGQLTMVLSEEADFSLANLNTLVRRLRLKVIDRVGHEPPIRAVYGKGYSFNGQINSR
jgi:DNA-binding response OmpR family regulator